MLKKNILWAFLMVLVLLLVGIFYLHQAEGWSYVDSFYFSTITLTTIGYGDLAPTQTSTKIFTSIYAILGVGIMLYLLSSVVAAYLIHPRFGRIFSVFSKLRYHEKEIKDLKKEIKKKK